jgi:transcriptional regulator with XRE-family HTH domain
MTPITFNTIMRQWRTGKNLSQVEMAKLLNVSQQTYDFYEKGREPKLGFIKKYREVTGVDLIQFEIGPKLFKEHYHKDNAEYNAQLQQNLKLFYPEGHPGLQQASSSPVQSSELVELKKQNVILMQLVNKLFPNGLPTTKRKPASKKRAGRSAAGK